MNRAVDSSIAPCCDDSCQLASPTSCQFPAAAWPPFPKSAARKSLSQPWSGLEHQRWVFPSSESKGKSAPRIVYLTDKAMEITRRLMLQHPTGALFRNSRGKPWTPDSVNSAVDRIRLRMGKAEMERLGEMITDDEIDRVTKTLNPFGRVKGKKLKRAKWQLRCQARRKLKVERAKQLVPRYLLYALRHSWATNSLKRGLDSLTLAILMGHQDPSMLAKVYQHLSHNPEHLLEQAQRAAM